MDGHFVPNLTFGPPVVASADPIRRFPLMHLMVDHPGGSLNPCSGGAIW